MLQYWNSPFGLIDMYVLFMSVGLVATILLQVVVLKSKMKKWRYLWFVISFGIVTYIGQYFSVIVRAMNNGALHGEVNLWTCMKDKMGSHYLGYVLAYACLFYAAAWFVREFADAFFHFRICENDGLKEVREWMSIGLLVQHIANRLACLCRGCCYGIPYEGPLALSLHYNVDMNYTVFPCQIVEIAGMVITLFVVLLKIKKHKTFYTTVLRGFGITFLIAEFVTENPTAYKIGGMTYIQFLSVVLILVSLFMNRRKEESVQDE